MGKASKWIRNFLIGKKEEKDKKEICSAADIIPATQTAIIPATPKVKRRWSFGRSLGRETSHHKFSKSLDDTITKAIQAALAESKTQQNNHARSLAIVRKHNNIENAAATKIQAIFRSFLARKALCALRGLVKLQALVRGYLVRKQATATLRCMHALMSIQVRARVQRIQMAEESQVDVKRHSSARRSFSQENAAPARRSFSQENAMRKAHNMDTNPKEKHKASNPNHAKIERRHGINTYYSGDLSMLKQEHRIEEYLFDKTHNSPQECCAMSKHDPTRATYNIMQQEYIEDYISHDYQLVPNFMANTESSRAKARSQSAPKQRPIWCTRQESRRTTSMDGMIVPLDGHMQHSPSSARRTSASRNQEPWLIKLYKSTMSYKDNECNSTSSMTSNSAYCRSLIAYEPHVTLY